MKPVKLERREQSSGMPRRNPRRDTRIHASLNEEALSGESSDGPASSSVVTTRGMASLGPDLEVANFRRRYKAFIHPSSVSSLRKNYPESIRSVGQQFYAAVSAEGRRVCTIIPSTWKIFLLSDHRNPAWGSHCVYLAGPPAVEFNTPLLTYGGKWSRQRPRETAYTVQVYDWYVDAKGAWMNGMKPSYGGQVQDAFELSEDEHTSKLASAFGVLSGNHPTFHYLVSNFSLSRDAAEALKDCALLLTCSYGLPYWMSHPYFNFLGEEQLRLAVASASRWKEIESFLTSPDYDKIRSQSWKGKDKAPDIVLRGLRAEYRSMSASLSLSQIRRASVHTRDRNAERARKKQKVDAVARARAAKKLLRDPA